MSDKLKRVSTEETVNEQKGTDCVMGGQIINHQVCHHHLNHRLERHLSAPERLKSVCEPNNHLERPNRNLVNILCAAGRLDSHHQAQSSPQHRFTHSHSERSSFDKYNTKFHHHHQSITVSPSSQSSASPSSSSSKSSSTSAGSSSTSTASDSAFSQSQTTLESESEQSTNHCFSRSVQSLKGESKVTFDASTYDGSDEKDEELENHFKIIWKNLTYQVPEKRFARVSAFIERQKKILWPKKEATEQVDDPIQVGDGLVDPPLKAPTIGKPRKIIFANLNGCVKSGQITAILGPSGAGKTTFLKCLTNNLVKGVSGYIDIIGSPTTSRHLKLCIIPQKGELNRIPERGIIFLFLKNYEINHVNLQ